MPSAELLGLLREVAEEAVEERYAHLDLKRHEKEAYWPDEELIGYSRKAMAREIAETRRLIAQETARRERISQLIQQEHTEWQRTLSKG